MRMRVYLAVGLRRSSRDGDVSLLILRLPCFELSCFLNRGGSVGTADEGNKYLLELQVQRVRGDDAYAVT